MDTDRELLEWAARAAGYKVKWFDGATRFNYTGFLKEDPHLTHYNDIPVRLHWNPLKDSGQALELVVKLGLSLRRDSLDVSVFLRVREMNCGELGQEMLRDDPLAATRRAIVRAAAEIGKAMA